MRDFHRRKRNAGDIGALVRSSGFLVALLIASGVSLFAIVIAAGAMRSRVLAVGVVFAAFAGLAVEGVLSIALLLALVLLAVGSLVAAVHPAAIRVAALIPGGVVLVTLAASDTPGWARGIVLVALLLASPTSGIVDCRFTSLVYVLVAISSLGVYATVPDTEQARSLVGALLPVAAAALVWRRSPESAGPSVSVALVAWVGLVGGFARPGAVVGAIGCLGVLVLGPMCRRSTAILLFVVHVAVVLVASRVAGLRYSAWTAAAVVVPVMLLAALVLKIGNRGSSRTAP